MSGESTTAVTAAVSGGSYLEVTVPLTPAYTNQYVNVSPTSVTISIPLVPGDQTTTTPEQVVGRLSYWANRNLMGTLTVWSNFDPSTNTLTFCSNDLIDPDSTYLSTYPQGGRAQTCRQHTYLTDTAPCGTNPNWNYCSPLTPGLMQAFQNSVREANQSVIAAAIQQGYTVIVRTPMPPVDAVEAANLLLVYENGIFRETYDPDKEYGEDFQVHNLESTWYGEIYLAANDNFANVIGSTGDPKIAGKSWLALWQSQFGAANACSSLNFPAGFQCGSYLVGGHVVLGTVATPEPSGSNNVFIMPICAGHNANDNVYMAPVTYSSGIALHNYLQNVLPDRATTSRSLQ